jgi:DNA-binding NarL/FixJ family response regulator
MPNQSNETQGMLPEGGVSRTLVAVCETQPVTAQGIRTLIETVTNLQFSTQCTSLSEATTWAESFQSCSYKGLLLLDKAFGHQATFDWLLNWKRSRAFQPELGIVIWGTSVTEIESLRLLEAGVHGIIRKTADTESVLACLNAVANGQVWIEDFVVRQTGESRVPSDLTSRESEVLALVELGLKNNQIANELGIRPGTVKIHLKHIFEKTGVRGRYRLALSSPSRGRIATA